MSKISKKVKTVKLTKKAIKSVCNLIILDASGSMQDKKAEVIGGLKGLFADIKKEKMKQQTIVCDFSGNGDFRVMINTSDNKKLTDAVAAEYSTRGMTALNDAVGKAFQLVPKKTDVVFVNIITDGLENDSKEFTADQVKDLIEKAKTKKWAVTFMGTTQEAALTAQRSLGISAGNTMTYSNNAKGMLSATSSMSSSRSSYLTSSLKSKKGITQDALENLIANNK